VPGNARIIGRSTPEVNRPASNPPRARGWRLGTVAVCVALLLGCSEGRAERMYRKAQKLIAEDQVEEAVVIYERILGEYPDTEAASKAEEEIGIYRSLVGASAIYPSRRARDVVIGAARAVETYGSRTGRYPESLDKLVSRYLDALPVDPWNRPLRYRKKPGRRGYAIACYGEDGRPGGDGDDADIFVENGRFVRKPSVDLP
jgi:general secretion pathway protein G